MIRTFIISLTFCGIAFANTVDHLKEAEEMTKNIIDYTAPTSTEIKEIMKADKATLKEKAEQNYSGAKLIYQDVREPSEKLKKQLLNEFQGVQHLFNNLQEVTGVKCNFAGVQEYQEIKKEFYTEEQEEETIEKRSCIVSAFDKEEVCEEDLRSLECVQTLKTTCEKVEDKPPFSCNNCKIQKDKIIFDLKKGNVEFFIEDKTRIKKMTIKKNDISSLINSYRIWSDQRFSQRFSQWESGSLLINNFEIVNFVNVEGDYSGMSVTDLDKVIEQKKYIDGHSISLDILDLLKSGKNTITGNFYGEQKKIIFYTEYETKKICSKIQDKWEEVCEKL